MTRFFISYQKGDREWAVWLSDQLFGSGHECVSQECDFRPGSNFPVEMDRALKRTDKTLVVLSPAYLKSAYTRAEWAAAFKNDADGRNRKLIPVKVAPCEPRGILGPIVGIDLVGVKSEAVARDLFLRGISEESTSRKRKSAFPGKATSAENGTSSLRKDHVRTPLDQYRQVVAREFKSVRDYLKRPRPESNTSRLLFGLNFPFGKKKPVRRIVRCAIVYDVEEFLDATVGRFHAPDSQWAATLASRVTYKAASTRWRILVSTVADGLRKLDNDVLLTPLMEGLEGHDPPKNPGQELRSLATDYAREMTSNDDFGISTRLLYLLGATCRAHDITVSDLLSEELKRYRHHGAHVREQRREREAANVRVLEIFFKDERGSYDGLLRSLVSRDVNIESSSSWTLVLGRVACCRLRISLPAGMNEDDLRSILVEPRRSGDTYSFEILDDVARRRRRAAG